jgi:hypothetical protein
VDWSSTRARWTGKISKPQRLPLGWLFANLITWPSSWRWQGRPCPRPGALREGGWHPRHGSALRWPTSKDVWRPEVGTGRGSDPAMTAPGPAGAAFRRVGTLMPSQAWWYGGIGVNRDLKACLGRCIWSLREGCKHEARYTGRRQPS